MGLPRESWLAGIALGVALGAAGTGFAQTDAAPTQATAAPAQTAPAPQVTAANQPKPMEKPRRVRMICPAGRVRVRVK